MNFLIRAAVVLVLAAVVFLAVEEQRKPEEPVREIEFEKAEEVVETPPPPGGYKNAGTLLTYYIVIAALGGFILLKWILPAIGSRMEDAMFTAPEQPKDAAARARALMVSGDYAEAITEWSRAAMENPGDPQPVLAIAKIHREKLQEPDAAIQVLETAAGGEFAPEQRADILIRLAEIYVEDKSDFARARELLQEVLSIAPGTAPAVEAQRQLQDVEEREFLASRNNQQQ